MDEQVLVSETFVSLQGEGSLVGVPSWFCRLSGCNLRCRWCDTPYASWTPEGERRSPEDLVAEATDAGVGHAVLTGGEPMIFEGLPGLCTSLREAGLHVTVETAGTVDQPELECDLLSVSPKLSNSTPEPGDPRDPQGAWAARHEERRLDVGVVQLLLDRHAPSRGLARQMKFVVTGPGDLGEIEALLEQLDGWRPDEVLLMPEGVKAPDPASVSWAVEACLERGWRYCHRLHIELFGDTRGT